MTFVLIYTLVFAFIFGAAIGSFLNVVIYRVPEKLSVVHPPSRCPVCQTQIRWYDNIPVLSWCILRGKCRECGTPIAARYMLVELFTGLVSAGLWYRVASVVLAVTPTLEAIEWRWMVVPWILHFTFSALLIVITFVDFDHFLIPHEFTLPGMVVGLASPWILEYTLGPQYIFVIWPPTTPLVGFIGFLAGGLAVLAIFYAYLAVRGIEGMGGGDVTLMAMVGAWLGWPALVFVFFAASLQGVLAAGITTLLGIDFVKDSREIFDDEETEQGDPTENEPAKEVPQGEVQEFESAGDDAEFDQSEEIEGKGAVPFGPFIALAAFEFLVLGPYLPPEFSMIYLYF